MFAVGGSRASGGATGAHELSLLIGFFIQLVTDGESIVLCALSDRLRCGKILTESLFVRTTASKPQLPVSSCSSKATQSLFSSTKTIFSLFLFVLVRPKVNDEVCSSSDHSRVQSKSYAQKRFIISIVVSHLD